MFFVACFVLGNSIRHFDLLSLTSLFFIGYSDEIFFWVAVISSGKNNYSASE
jgi:hypothetical protein